MKNTQNSKDKPKPDPFEKPPADLLIAEVPTTAPSHILVLNKYPVINNHFILATKTSKPQTDLLESDDLSIAYECLKAWAKDAPKDQPRRLFAFFNSGEHSGASQAHRHLQFLPFEDMKDASGGKWQLLIDRMTTTISESSILRRDPGLPFLHYATELLEDIPAHDLYSKYTSLLRAAVLASRRNTADAEIDHDEPIDHNGKAVISYNLAMTENAMAIVPRRLEAGKVPSSGGAIGSVAINGTILGGTLMVKDEHEWDTLREKPSILDDMLTTIGYPVSENGVLDRTKL